MEENTFLEAGFRMSAELRYALCEDCMLGWMLGFSGHGNEHLDVENQMIRKHRLFIFEKFIGLKYVRNYAVLLSSEHCLSIRVTRKWTT